MVAGEQRPECGAMAKEKRILVVEDDEPIRALLLTILRRRGFRVDTASHGRDGIERLKRCNYSLVLLDLMMPVMSGYEFLAALEEQESGHRPLVIVLTAGVIPQDLNPAVVAGTIRKPFDVQLLTDTVSACLSTLGDVPQMDSCPSPESDRSRGAGGEPN